MAFLPRGTRVPRLSKQVGWALRHRSTCGPNAARVRLERTFRNLRTDELGIFDDSVFPCGEERDRLRLGGLR